MTAVIDGDGRIGAPQGSIAKDVGRSAEPPPDHGEVGCSVRFSGMSRPSFRPGGGRWATTLSSGGILTGHPEEGSRYKQLSRLQRSVACRFPYEENPIRGLMQMREAGSDEISRIAHRSP